MAKQPELTTTPSRLMDVIDAHIALWDSMRMMIDKGHISQPLLFVGPRHASILPFAHRLIATILCQGDTKPCGSCSACRLFIQGIHPDVYEVVQDPPGSAIKIEQIRALQLDVYLKPLCSSYRFILINPADQLNRQAANALLKILEEPPAHTVFILIAEQLDTLPQTIISRCQCTLFSPPEGSSSIDSDYLMLGGYYPEGSSRKGLFDDRDKKISQWCDLLEGKADLCRLAMEWSKLALEDVLWFLYLLTATLIVHVTTTDRSADTSLSRMKRVYQERGGQSMHLFMQLDALHAFIRKNNQNIPLNQTLVIESLLLGYLGKPLSS